VPTVMYELDAPIAYLTLNRPDRLNALSGEVLTDLNDALDVLDEDDNARVAVIRGSGRAFCVGFDLISGGAAEEPGPIWADRMRMRRWIKTFLRLRECQKPVVAQIHGYCFAGGLMIPPCCDVSVVADNCRLGLTKLPLGGGYVGPVMALKVGGDRAALLEFDVGREIDGATAAAWGYATLSVGEEVLESTVHDLALSFARIPASLAALKKAAIVAAVDRRGFRATYEAATEWDALAHADPSAERFRKDVRNLGMRQAIESFRAQLGSS
jgi:enoyl-CoA hydratase